MVYLGLEVLEQVSRLSKVMKAMEISWMVCCGEWKESKFRIGSHPQWTYGMKYEELHGPQSTGWFNLMHD